MERVINCPVCADSDHCFEDMQKEFSSFCCFKCGFMSFSGFIEGSNEWNGRLQTSPQLVRDLQFFDEERNIYWIPSVINMGQLGVIYPEGNLLSWKWKYAKPIEIPEDQRYKYPIPDTDEEFYESRLDVENAKEYNQLDFISACKEIGITTDLRVNKNNE